MKRSRIPVTLAVLSFICCCGDGRLLVRVPPEKLIVADPIPSALPGVTIEPSAGPLLDTPECTNDFAALVASVGQYETEVAGSGMSLFRDLDRFTDCQQWTSRSAGVARAGSCSA